MTTQLAPNAKTFGTVNFNGKRLILTQQAYLDQDPVQHQNPRAGEKCYLAAAIDDDGNTYRVTWYPYEDFDGEDESNACNWEAPHRIELVVSANKTQLAVTMTDNHTGVEHEFNGDSLQELASQAEAATAGGADLTRGVVRKDNGELVGWVHGDGQWRYA